MTDTNEWQVLDAEPSDCKQWQALETKKEAGTTFWKAQTKLADGRDKLLVVSVSAGGQWTMEDSEGVEYVTNGDPKTQEAMKDYLSRTVGL